MDSKEEYALFVNENRYEGEINSLDKLIDFLTIHYLNSPQQKQIEDSTGILIEKKPIEIREKTEEEVDIETRKISLIGNFFMLIVILGSIFLIFAAIFS